MSAEIPENFAERLSEVIQPYLETLSEREYLLFKLLEECDQHSEEWRDLTRDELEQMLAACRD